MKQSTKYLLAALSCMILLFLFAFMGKPDIVFQSVWAEIFVAVLLFLGAGLFLWAAFQNKEE
jgi:protein-S-isoprenylcysteine O-methyltransferase Ste14